MTNLPHAAPILLTAELRNIEQAALKGNKPAPLMARAGLAAAELARTLAGDSGKPILIVAGPGNNGGDALFAGALLARRGMRVDALGTTSAVHVEGLAAMRRGR
jgi:NAD(P)H-hydrate repair Nnr-like enzyme with NAD(P)H-hydrate epimerase domain